MVYNTYTGFKYYANVYLSNNWFTVSKRVHIPYIQYNIPKQQFNLLKFISSINRIYKLANKCIKIISSLKNPIEYIKTHIYPTRGLLKGVKNAFKAFKLTVKFAKFSGKLVFALCKKFSSIIAKTIKLILKPLARGIINVFVKPSLRILKVVLSPIIKMLTFISKLLGSLIKRLGNFVLKSALKGGKYIFLFAKSTGNFLFNCGNNVLLKLGNTRVMQYFKDAIQWIGKNGSLLIVNIGKSLKSLMLRGVSGATFYGTQALYIIRHAGKKLFLNSKIARIFSKLLLRSTTNDAQSEVFKWLNALGGIYFKRYGKNAIRWFIRKWKHVIHALQAIATFASFFPGANFGALLIAGGLAALDAYLTYKEYESIGWDKFSDTEKVWAILNMAFNVGSWITPFAITKHAKVLSTIPQKLKEISKITGYHVSVTLASMYAGYQSKLYQKQEAEELLETIIPKIDNITLLSSDDLIFSHSFAKQLNTIKDMEHFALTRDFLNYQNYVENAVNEFKRTHSLCTHYIQLFLTNCNELFNLNMNITT